MTRTFIMNGKPKYIHFIIL